MSLEFKCEPVTLGDLAALQQDAQFGKQQVQSALYAQLLDKKRKLEAEWLQQLGHFNPVSSVSEKRLSEPERQEIRNRFFNQLNAAYHSWREGTVLYFHGVSGLRRATILKIGTSTSSVTVGARSGLIKAGDELLAFNWKPYDPNKGVAVLPVTLGDLSEADSLALYQVMFPSLNLLLQE